MLTRLNVFGYALRVVAKVKLGDAVLTLGGFVDFENVFRTTNKRNRLGVFGKDLEI